MKNINIDDDWPRPHPATLFNIDPPNPPEPEDNSPPSDALPDPSQPNKVGQEEIETQPRE